MKLFISWSGARSQQIAQQMREWFPLILPSVAPFITTTDIEKGARWQGEISRELDESNYGVVCLTADNLESRWIAFEAGALSKHLHGRVATVLFGIERGMIQPPLSMFQSTLFNEAEMRQLVSNIDAAVPDGQRRGDAQLDQVFPRMWPMLEAPVRLILENAAEPPPPAAADWAIIAQEMMALLRQQNAVLSSPEKFLAPVLAQLDAARGPAWEFVAAGSRHDVLRDPRTGMFVKVARRDPRTGMPYVDAGEPIEEILSVREEPNQSATEPDQKPGRKE